MRAIAGSLMLDGIRPMLQVRNSRRKRYAGPLDME
jgi:hypothetical protein